MICLFSFCEKMLRCLAFWGRARWVCNGRLQYGVAAVQEISLSSDQIDRLNEGSNPRPERGPGRSKLLLGGFSAPAAPFQGLLPGLLGASASCFRR